MVSAQKIKYNSPDQSIHEALNQIEVVLDVAFNSDDGETSSYLNRSAVAAESYDGRYKNTYRYKYDELFSPCFTIIKKDFSDFTPAEVRKVLKYLTSTDKPALLEVYYDADSNSADWTCIGGWTSIETYKVANSRVVGIVAKFEAITPYAMSDIMHTEPKTISSAPDNKITITINTDDSNPIYPYITIQHTGGLVIPYNRAITMYDDIVPNTAYRYQNTYYWKSDESSFMVGNQKPNYGWEDVVRSGSYSSTDIMEKNVVYYYTADQKYRWIDPYTFHTSGTPPTIATTGVKLVNQHRFDENSEPSTPVTMMIKNNTSTEKIIIDGANRIIYSTNTRRIFGDDFINWSWLPLYEGINEITVDGNCTIDISYRTVIKYGEY